MLIDHKNSMSLISFGEILWDVIENHVHLGGAAYNLAAHASRLGLDVRLVSSVGDDDLGRQALSEAEKLGVDTSCIKVNSMYPTGVVNVKLHGGQPEYQIHGPAAWDFIDCPSEKLKDGPKSDVICFGTLAQRSETSRVSLRDLLECFPETPTFYDVNLRQEYFSRDLIDWGFRQATIVKVNNTESEVIAVMIFGRELTCEEFAQELCRHYGVEVVLVTLGAYGCYVATSTSITHVPCKTIDVLDTVGAGDAFSAGFLSSWLRGLSFVEAASVGNELGAYTATMHGAVPLYSSQLRSQLTELGVTR